MKNIKATFGRPAALCIRTGLAALALAAVFAWAATPGFAQGDDAVAREIMQKVNDRDDGDNSTAELEMILIDKNKKRRVRKLKTYGKDKGKDSYSLMFFLSPADVKNTGFLTYDYDESGRSDDQWLYLPALRKTKRIASDDKSGSFMGSDFNFSDMSRPDLEDFDFKLIKEIEIGGVKTWQIRSTPRSKDVAEETGYSRSILWVRQDNYMVIRSVRWVNKSRRRKFFQVKKLEKIDGIWVATELQMVTKEGRNTVHATILRQTKTKFNQNLSDSNFTVRKLEKGP